MNAAASARFVCQALDASHSPSLSRLFERAHSSCFCQYWHFVGDKNDWLARLAFDSERNRDALSERARLEPPRGVVAVAENGDVLGWMKLEPADDVSKIYDQKLYRRLPCFEGDRRGAWTIGCFLVDPAHRRRGIARALVKRGVELARSNGARMLEAFPRRAEGVGEEELWTGPFALLASEGFDVVHDQTQYPVMRRLF